MNAVAMTRQPITEKNVETFYFILFFIQFNVPFKIISLISRRANREYPGKTT